MLPQCGEMNVRVDDRISRKCVVVENCLITSFWLSSDKCVERKFKFCSFVQGVNAMQCMITWPFKTEDINAYVKSMISSFCLPWSMENYVFRSPIARSPCDSLAALSAM